MDTLWDITQRLHETVPPRDEGDRLNKDLSNLIYELRNSRGLLEDKLALNDFINRLRLNSDEIIAYARPFIKTDTITADIKSIAEVPLLVDQISAIDMLLQHVRAARSRRLRREPLVGSISYCPETSEVFFGHIRVSKPPRANSMERSVWRLLYECDTMPRRATFERLEQAKDSRGHTLFSRLDDSITSDIEKWNKKFKRFGVNVLHKDGDSIVIYEQPLAKK